MEKAALFTSNSEDWETPQALFDKYNGIYNFQVDLCASDENKKCDNFISKHWDSLSLDWNAFKGNLWLNPPYGREIGKWIKKAYESKREDRVIVCLLPSRTDTKWFHEYCVKGKIEFIKGRLKFNKSINSAPFPSMIVIF